jgi:hypothetical protein
MVIGERCGIASDFDIIQRRQGKRPFINMFTGKKTRRDESQKDSVRFSAVSEPDHFPG